MASVRVRGVAGDARVLNLNDLYIQRFLEQQFPIAVIRSNGWLLDLGCGGQPYQDVYRRAFDNAIAVDASYLPGIHVRARAEQLPFTNDSFECVVATELLEHVYRFDLALGEIRRVLAPDGRLILTWPLCHHLHDVPDDYWRFTEFAVARQLRALGFDVEKIFRRGDLIAVLLTGLGGLASGTALAVQRIPLMGSLLKPVGWAVDALAYIVYRAFVAISNRWRRLNPSSPGTNLRGAQSLALWTLGYCAVARLRTDRP